MLLDLKMPGRNGFEVLEWTRNQDRFKDLPIIVLSSSDRPEDLQRAFRPGRDLLLEQNRFLRKRHGHAQRLLVDRRVQPPDRDRSPGFAGKSNGSALRLPFG